MFLIQVERWTNRTNQLMAQAAKADNEEIRKLQNVKGQHEKTIVALQEDVKRTKAQLDVLKRESLRLKTEKTENQVYLFLITFAVIRDLFFIRLFLLSYIV